MSARPTKLQRWLDMVAYLAGRRLPVSTEQLWNAVPAYHGGLDGTEKEKQTVRRMFERDKDELRALGIPIETIPYSINYGLEQTTGYRLTSNDFHLPYLRLVSRARDDPDGPRHAPGDPRAVPNGRDAGARDRDGGSDAPRAPATSEFPIDPDEAGAALEGLSDLAAVPSFPLRVAARSAFRKLAFDLEPDVLRESPVVYAEDPEAAATRGALHVLSDAVRRKRTVCFGYRSMARDAEGERTVEPYGLLFQHGRWYMVGRDREREAERMFRLGRMKDLALAAPRAKGPEYEVPEGFDLEAYGGRAAWELGEDPEGAIEAEVRIAFPRSLWAERNGHGELVRELGDGSQLRRFRVLRRDPFLRWVLSLAGDARVEAPDELRDAFRALAGEVIRRHGGGAHA